MTPPANRKKLVVLVADLDAANAIAGILERWRALGIREVGASEYDIFRHPQRDAGCRGEAAAFLEGFLKTHQYALVVFDRHGCGWDDRPPLKVEGAVEEALAKAGWKGRCAAILLDPELEAWIWSDSPHVDDELGWKDRQPPLREWLSAEVGLLGNTGKPSDPKKAMIEAMRLARKPLSSRIFSNLAGQVSLQRCNDRAFLRLKAVLGSWFPGPEAVTEGRRC